MKIDHRGNIDRRQPHKGLYIATGAGGFKLCFKPGVNTVAAEDWAKVKDSPGVRKRLAGRRLVVLEDDSAGKAKSMGFAELDAAEQHDLVRRTIDPDVLREWSRAKKLDPDVAKALQEQLSAVTTDARGNPSEPRRIELSPIRIPEGIPSPTAPAPAPQ